MLKEVLLLSEMDVRCDVLWVFDKHTSQYFALSMDNEASKLAIGKDNVLEDVSSD